MNRFRRGRRDGRYADVEEAMAALDVLEERIDRLWDRLNALLDRAMDMEEGGRSVPDGQAESTQES